ncbi:TcaA NTF2-like domain-containing protein [Metabacillus sp. RGM 3146]|uniref:TcaA NTF2-like domain-containing protein n=1 Tax=Metabacillus sp. RGM 3146 TaxID=3401092 RepID=UPI003B9C6C81
MGQKWLDKKGIREGYNGFELISWEPAPEGYYVQTKDSFTIYYKDGTYKDKTFHSKFLVEYEDGTFKVDSLLSTNEI